MIGIVDYGLGNVGSLHNALELLGCPNTLSGDPDRLSQFQGLILPGVGSFGPAMQRLESLDLIPFLKDWSEDNRPLMGICLGMQLLLTTSEEGESQKGLDIIPGQVVKLADTPRSIHIGWNRIIPKNKTTLLPASGYGYFVHSYVCRPANPDVVVGETIYGVPFAAVIQSERTVGIQFHPEKSQSYGLGILKRFVNEAL